MNEIKREKEAYSNELMYYLHKMYVFMHMDRKNTRIYACDT